MQKRERTIKKEKLSFPWYHKEKKETSNFSEEPTIFLDVIMEISHPTFLIFNF